LGKRRLREWRRNQVFKKKPGFKEETEYVGGSIGAYERAGVREYWLAAPRTRSVEVYSLSEDGTYEMAGQYTPGETITSTVLSDLALPVDDLFVR
jgi:Uma2 family endonuclease